MTFAPKQKKKKCWLFFSSRPFHRSLTINSEQQKVLIPAKIGTKKAKTFNIEFRFLPCFLFGCRRQCARPPKQCAYKFQFKCKICHCFQCCSSLSAHETVLNNMVISKSPFLTPSRLNSCWAVLITSRHALLHCAVSFRYCTDPIAFCASANNKCQRDEAVAAHLYRGPMRKWRKRILYWNGVDRNDQRGQQQVPDTERGRHNGWWRLHIKKMENVLFYSGGVLGGKKKFHFKCTNRFWPRTFYASHWLTLYAKPEYSSVGTRFIHSRQSWSVTFATGDGRKNRARKKLSIGKWVESIDLVLARSIGEKWLMTTHHTFTIPIECKVLVIS